MKTKIKCYRCGTEIPVNYKNMSAIMTCPHCKGKMTYDVTTYRKLKLVRYFVVLLVALLLLFGMHQVETGNYAILLIFMSIAISLACVADKACLWLCDFIFGLHYEELKTKKKK